MASTRAASPSTSSSDALPPAAQGVEPCPGDADRQLSIRAGGRHIVGYVRGSGRRVAILSHQFRGTPCDLAALGAMLAEAGFRVVAWTAEHGLDVTALTSLVERERARGARRVVLVGASAGAARSLVVARYDGPLMVVAGQNDPGFAEVPEELAPAHDGPEDMRTIAGTSNHGKDLVSRRTEPLAADVLAFITQHVGR